MLSKGDIYTNECDGKQISYTVKAVKDSFVVVYSSNLDREYILSQVVFEDTMRVLGFTLQPNKLGEFTIVKEALSFIEGESDMSLPLYRIYYINHNYYSPVDYETCNQAIRAGKEAGMEFRVELGDMVCCAWSPIGGLRFFAEYQYWAQNQVYKLAQVAGEV
jgi:hypothetical protein